jgi:RNA polymerase sigma-70 factor (ECF subfamily)
VSDATLIAAARSDPREFGQLYERYVDSVYRYIACRIATATEAEDLVASIFLQALQGMPAYQGRSSFRSWLSAIAHHALVDHYRKRRRTPIVAQVEGTAQIADTHPGPERQFLDRERLDQVTHAWQRLSPDQQAALALKFSAALTNQEIGRVLGKSEGELHP